MPGKTRNEVLTELGVRFSAFGRLFTTWGIAREKLPEPVVAGVIGAVRAAGFHYVDTESLDEPYDGQHPTFLGGTWWYRYFDYY